MGGGGHGGYWRLYIDDTGHLPRSPGILNHPEEMVPPRIGEETQTLVGGPGEGLLVIRCTIFVE